MAAWGPFGQRRSVMAVAGDIELSDGGFWCQYGRARWPLAGAARSAVPMVSLIVHAWADGPAVGSAAAPAGGLTAAEGMRRGQQLLALLQGGAESAADAVAATTVADDLVQPQVVGAAVAGASGRCGAWHDVRSRRKHPRQRAERGALAQTTADAAAACWVAQEAESRAQALRCSTATLVQRRVRSWLERLQLARERCQPQGGDKHVDR